MATKQLNRKYYMVKTEKLLPQETEDGAIYYTTESNQLFIDMDGTRRQVNPSADWTTEDPKSQTYIANKPDLGSASAKNVANSLDNSDDLPTSGQVLDAINDAKDDYNEKITNAISDYNEKIDNAIADITDSGIASNTRQLLSDVCTTDTEPYTLRATTGQSDRAYVDAIVGGTVVWNQLTRNEITTPTGTGVTFTKNADGTYTANGTAETNCYAYTDPLEVSRTKFQSNHVYFISGCPSGGSVSTYRLGLCNGALSVIQDVGTGGTLYKNIANYNSGITAVMFVFAEVTVSNLVFKPQIHDLTQMFGSTIANYIYSLEQSSAGAGVAWFRKYFPNDYYPYNPGELVSVGGVSEKDVVGFNQWDEEWELGYIDDTGKNVSRNSTIRSKNYIKVLPNTQYVFKCQKTGAYVYYYDSEKKFIRKASTGGNSLITTPSNCHYMRFRMYDPQYGTTYTNDICISIYSPIKSFIYEPYTKHTYLLDSTLTLRGIPQLVDGKLTYDGDEYRPDGTVKRKYGIITLTGDEKTWYYSENGSKKRVYALIANALQRTKNYLGTYIVDGSDSSYPNVWEATINTTPSLIIGVPDTITNADDWKAYLSSHPLTIVYELANPNTETAEPYQATQLVYPGGTEEYVSTSIVPVGHSTRYPDNLRKKIEGLPWDFSSLIAPTEATATASRNYTTGSLLIMGNILYKVTSNIASGSAITPNSNVVATTLSEIISALS